MAKFDPKAQVLVAAYLDCLQSKDRADERLKSAKEKLLAYSQASKKKTLYTKSVKVTVSVKNRTVFPKYNQPGRKELEAAVRAAGYWDQTLSFDVVKLAEAYDSDRLPAKLKSRLAPLARTDRQARIFVNQTA